MTIEEIAKIACVSKATVSRVLNHSPIGVSEETRLRVEAVIREVNYVRNNRNTNSRNIALILPDISNPFFSEVVEVINAEAFRNNYCLILANTDFSEQREDVYLSRLVARGVEGIILVPSGNTAKQRHCIPQKFGIPMLLLDRKLKGKHNLTGVYSDTEFAAFKSCEVMIKDGAGKIAFIGGTEGTSTTSERLHGYEDAVKQYKLDYCRDLVCMGNYTMQSGYDAVMQMIRKEIAFEAILAANDLMAIGAMQAVKECGFKIPEQVEVMGFDNVMFSQCSDPPLSTCQQPTTEMGRLAVDNIMKLIKGEDVSDKKLKPRLVLRKTTKNID